MGEKKDRRLKILFNSNAPHTNSGYGREMEHLLPLLKKDGWQIAMNAFVGHEGAPREIDGILHYPKLQDTWGSDGMVFNARHFGAHVVIPFADAWVFNPQFLQQVNADGRKLIFYVPIDQEPVPINVLNNLKFAYKIITFSAFGQKALQRAGFTSKLILEGTDTNIFKPLDKAESRKTFGIPNNKFIIGMVGANKENPPRKGWQQALEAFKLFHDKHPESLFFFQTNQNNPGGFPLMPYAHMLGIDKYILHMDDYLATFHAGSEVMAKLYNSFDILSSASLSEGFSLCPVEAMSCGIPVIVNDCQSQPELVIPEKTGLICKRGFAWYTNAGGYHYFPDVNSLYEKYEQLFRSDREKMGKAAREHVLAKYDINKIYEQQWKPMLIALQDELLGKLTTEQK